MASSYNTLTLLTYVETQKDGDSVKAIFSFQGEGASGGSVFDAGDTWDVSMDNTTGPMCVLLKDGTTEVSGVTATITESYSSSREYTGKLELSPLDNNSTYYFQAYDEYGTPTVDMNFTTALNTNQKAKDLASGTLAESISASTTNLAVYVGEGSATTIQGVFPDTPFYITVMPTTPAAGVANFLDSEIMKITEVGVDQAGDVALTATRAQRGTTAQAFDSGAIVTVGIYAEDSVLLSDDGTSETETPWLSAASLIWSTMVNKIYPVGSIYLSATLSTAKEVGAVLGGTWEAWGSGKVPVGVDTTDTDFSAPEATGGEKTHTLTVDEMPSHNHAQRCRGVGNDIAAAGSDVGNEFLGTSDGSVGSTFDTGGDEAHNNLQPYITCYMYKRVS